MSGFMGGGGGYSASSSARSSVGPTSSGAGSVNVGGFNPPALPVIGNTLSNPVVMIGIAVVVLMYLRMR